MKKTSFFILLMTSALTLHAQVSQQWVARYNGPGNGDDIARDLKFDISGNVYVTGWSTGIGTGLDYTTIK